MAKHSIAIHICIIYSQLQKHNMLKPILFASNLHHRLGFALLTAILFEIMQQK